MTDTLRSTYESLGLQPRLKSPLPPELDDIHLRPTQAEEDCALEEGVPEDP